MTEKRLTPRARNLRRRMTDADRTRMIEAHGYSVIRFWNNDVMTNLDGVLEEIRRVLAICGNRA
jgi:very-short-patch-repair endonuclease